MARHDDQKGGWAIMGSGRGYRVFHGPVEPFKVTWRHRFWRVIHWLQRAARND